MVATLRDYFHDVNGEVLEERPDTGTSSGASHGGSAGLARGMGPALVSSPGGAPKTAQSIAQETIDAGRQYQSIAAMHKSLDDLLRRARSGDIPALAEVIRHYNFEPSELEVTITEPMLDARGQPPERFGIKLIGSEDEWASITRDWQTASVYFPGIELHNLATTRRGKRLAVVMGVNAREFNAVIAADRRRQRLEQELKTIDRNIEKGRKEMGVDKMPRVPAGEGKKAAAPETPPQLKAPAKAAPAKGARSAE